MTQYKEPWHIGYQLDTDEPPRWPEICDSTNQSLFTPRTEAEANRLLPVMERVIACVNKCQGQKL